MEINLVFPTNRFPDMISRRQSQLHLRIWVAIVLTVFFCFNLSTIHDGRSAVDVPRPSSDDTWYHSLPGANETLVVMRTGSTEIQDRLPIHLTTTMRRYPDQLIFSDFEESFGPYQIIDALQNVAPSLKEQSPDFELWRRLRKHGRVGLRPEELSGRKVWIDHGTGKALNPGWKLDKFKFLPMVNRTLYEYPNKKWYIFVEPDTFFLWQTLLVYLSKLDWTMPYYIGGQINIGEIEFGQGGNGFVVSRPALENVVTHYEAHQQEWEDFTNGHWAGDCVLGKAFKDSGTPLLHAWPIFQGDDIGSMNYRQQNMWCQPTVSYHHLAPSVIQDLYDFEKDWMTHTRDNHTSFLRHRDMFAQYVMPRMTTPRVDWDNHSNDDRGPTDSLDDCRTVCQADDSCLQYAVSAERRCLTTSRPNVGQAAIGVQSGWLMERVQRFYDEGGECEGVEWIS